MKSIVLVGSWCSSSTRSLWLWRRIKIRIFCGNSGKTEILWWAFPVFTQEKAEDGVGEKSIIAAFEKQPDIHVNWKRLTFVVVPKRSQRLKQELLQMCSFDAPDGLVCMVKWKLVDLKRLLQKILSKHVNTKNIIQASKAGDTAYMYPIVQHHSTWRWIRRAKDAGVLDLVKEGWTDDFEKYWKLWKTKLKRRTKKT